jgi:hypothetical protein
MIHANKFERFNQNYELLELLVHRNIPSEVVARSGTRIRKLLGLHNMTDYIMVASPWCAAPLSYAAAHSSH